MFWQLLKQSRHQLARISSLLQLIALSTLVPYHLPFIFLYALSFFAGILHSVICLVGLFANGLSIPVLRSKDLYTSTFNRLLIILAINDIFYLTFALAESIRSDMEINTGDIHTKAFVHGLYPFHNIMLCMSIYMTVILAMERYRAVSKPIDYHTIIVSGKQWQRVFRYVIPVVCFCFIFNLPKFFELTTKQENYGNFSRVST